MSSPSKNTNETNNDTNNETNNDTSEEMYNDTSNVRPLRSMANYKRAAATLTKISILKGEVNKAKTKIDTLNHIVQHGSAGDAHRAAKKMATLAKNASNSVNAHNHMVNNIVYALVHAEWALSNAALEWDSIERILKNEKDLARVNRHVHANLGQFLQQHTNDYKRVLRYHETQIQPQVIVEAKKVAKLATELIDSVMETIKVQKLSARKEKRATANRFIHNNSFLNINNMQGGHTKRHRKQIHRKRTRNRK